MSCRQKEHLDLEMKAGKQQFDSVLAASLRNAIDPTQRAGPKPSPVRPIILAAQSLGVQGAIYCGVPCFLSL